MSKIVRALRELIKAAAHVIDTNTGTARLWDCVQSARTALAEHDAQPVTKPQVSDLRCAKWLDPECADAGACQSLKFKGAQPAAEPAPTHFWMVSNKVSNVCFASEADAKAMLANSSPAIGLTLTRVDVLGPAQPAAEPLTWDEIDGLAGQVSIQGTTDSGALIMSATNLHEFARAIEAAHNIKD
jgi:hypothetical protein